MLKMVAVLIVCWLPGCGDSSSIQRSQVAALPTPCLPTEPLDPRHTMATRSYTTWCGETCYTRVTEQLESGEAETWPPGFLPPMSTYQDPRNLPNPNVVCAPKDQP